MIRHVATALLKTIAIAFLLGTGLLVCVVMGIDSAAYHATVVLEEKAHQGNPRAQANLALGYQCGRSESFGFARLRPDKAKAEYWYLRSARSGDTFAACHLAFMYENQFPPARRSDALYWYRFAGSRNNLDAALRLSEIYEKGELGQPADPKMATYWKSRAEQIQNERNKFAL